MQKFFIIILLGIMLFIPCFSVAAGVEQIHADIDLEQQSFNECIKALSKTFELDITLSGDLKDIPDKKLNLRLEQATLEQAIKELVRKAGVQSHALILGGGKDVKIWVLRAGIQGSDDNSQNNQIGFYEDDMEPLTQEQMYLLAQHNEQMNEKDDHKPLTAEQMELLKERSDDIEEKMKDRMKPLTTEQMAKLQDKSRKIEAENNEARKPLSAEQLQKLKKQSAEMETEENNKRQPLNEEQLLLLKEQGRATEKNN